VSNDPTYTTPVPVRTLNLQVYLTTVASAVVPVTVTVTDLERVAGNLGKPVDALVYEDIRELVIERGHDNTPTLCHQCTGGNYAGQSSLELGDVWETEDERQSWDSDEPVAVPLAEIFTVRDDS